MTIVHATSGVVFLELARNGSVLTAYDKETENARQRNVDVRYGADGSHDMRSFDDCSRDEHCSISDQPTSCDDDRCRLDADAGPQHSGLDQVQRRSG